MDKKVKFYTVSFVNQMGEPNSLNVLSFLNNLEKLFLEDKLKVPSEAYGKNVYMFKYIRSDNNPSKEFVIPFGTLKQNTPYQTSDSNPKEITPANMKLYDINLFYYNADEGIAAMTCDRGAPNNKVVSTFLSSFIGSEEFMFSIKPILYETGIEVIRNSRFVKSVTIILNLDANINKYYNDNIHTESSLIKQILELIKAVKGEIDNRTFKLELGLGHSRRDSMNVENTLNLLSSFDLKSDVVKEVSLNFVGGGSEKVQLAKLKNKDIELNEMLPHEGKGSLLAGEMLDSIDIAIEHNRRVINKRLRDFNNSKEKTNGNIEIRTGEKNDRLPEEVYA